MDAEIGPEIQPNPLRVAGKQQVINDAGDADPQGNTAKPARRSKRPPKGAKAKGQRDDAVGQDRKEPHQSPKRLQRVFVRVGLLGCQELANQCRRCGKSDQRGKRTGDNRYFHD